MEKYRGIKFNCKTISGSFFYDCRLEELNYWSWMFSQIGLTPVHEKGAYGNMSYRIDDMAFIITKTGMIPERQFQIKNYTLVDGYDEESGFFLARGSSEPSSECFLHYRIYQQCRKVNIILHGHSTLMNEWAEELNIPVTREYAEYGTAELAESALEIISLEQPIIILKDHGFVAIGRSMADTGYLVLEKYRTLLSRVGGSVHEKNQ